MATNVDSAPRRSRSGPRRGGLRIANPGAGRIQSSKPMKSKMKAAPYKPSRKFQGRKIS